MAGIEKSLAQRDPEDALRLLQRLVPTFQRALPAAAAAGPVRPAPLAPAEQIPVAS
jgi:hypothetical protein